MQTEKLYYQNPYLRKFEAKILEKTALKDNRYALILDRTAFYPEGGGQPCDLGTLNEVPVLDVRTENGQVIHITDGDPGAGDVKGQIDWQRRFDHMQQHTGEHILSGIFLSLYQAENVGFHLSGSTCQIDVTLPTISAEQISIVETAANAAIFDNIPIMARFVENSELSAYKLRKEPGREFSQIRLVSITDCDCCPCGGTHLANTGEAGILKIRSWEKRKNNTRIDFVCGNRALTDYRLKHDIARTISASLSAPVEGILTAFEKNLEKTDSLQHDLLNMRKAYHAELASRLLAESTGTGTFSIISHVFSGYVTTDLQDFAGRITSTAGGICLIASSDTASDRSAFFFAAAPGAPVAMNELLRESLAPFGGKGGGNALQSQGGASIPDPAIVLQTATALLRQRLQQTS